MAIGYRHVSVPLSFCSGNIIELLKHFEICSKPNKWTAETKALKLPTVFEGRSPAAGLSSQKLNKQI